MKWPSSSQRVTDEAAVQRRLADAWLRIVSLINAARIRAEDAERAAAHGHVDVDRLLALVELLEMFADEFESALVEL